MDGLITAVIFYLAGIYSPDAIQQKAKGVVTGIYKKITAKLSGKPKPKEEVTESDFGDPLDEEAK